MADPIPTLWLIPLILVLFVVFFVAVWALAVFLISAAAGWSRLARYYRATTPFTGQRWSGQMAWMGLARYRSILTVGADGTGLYLEVMRIFRIGHPSLLIPWSDITTEERQVLFFPVVAFQFMQVPGVTLSLTRSTAEQVLTVRG